MNIFMQLQMIFLTKNPTGILESLKKVFGYELKGVGT